MTNGEGSTTTTLDAGSFEILNCEDFEAGTWVTLTFRYVVGASGLGCGGVLRIGLPNTAWSEPLVPLPRYWPEVTGQDRIYAPFQRVNTSVELVTQSQARAYLQSFTAMIPSDDFTTGAAGEKTNWRHWIDVTIEGDALAPGDEIRVIYGDRRFGEPGARVQTVPGTDVSFLAYLDFSGDGVFVEHPDSPLRRPVHAGPPAKTRVVVPSIVRPGEPFAARLAITDACHNRPVRDFIGSLGLRFQPADQAREVRFEQGAAPRSVISGLVLDSERVAHVVADGDLPATRSNPVRSCVSADRIFWGDIHVHSIFHDYNEDEHRGRWLDFGPDECYQYAKEVSFLDFAAVTDTGPSRTGWEQNQAAAEEHYEPGVFVTFRGYEAGLDEGHRHILFATGGIEPPYPRDFDYRFPALYEYYRGRNDVILIPHHTKAFPTWNCHDPALEPVVEVYSSWGSSELPGPDLWNKQSIPGASVQEALRRGYRLGMVASGDICPWPGRSFPGTMLGIAPFAGGLVAVFAEELTREAIFEAIRSRRCYATTGVRSILRFEVNDVAMGQEVHLTNPEQPRRIQVSIIGTDRIARVEIIKNCELLAASQSEDETLEWAVQDDSPATAGDFYYLRVAQVDGNRAWSSPIWIDFD